MIKYCYTDCELKELIKKSLNDITHTIAKKYQIKKVDTFKSIITKFINNNDRKQNLAKDIFIFCQQESLSEKSAEIYRDIFEISPVKKRIFNVLKTHEYHQLKANLPVFYTDHELYAYITKISDTLISNMLQHFKIHEKYNVGLKEATEQISHIRYLTGTNALQSFKSNISMIEDYFYEFENMNDDIEIISDEIFTYFLSKLGLNEEYIQYHCGRF